MDIKINYTLFLVNNWDYIFTRDIDALVQSELLDQCNSFNIFSFPFNDKLQKIIENNTGCDYKIHIYWQNRNRYEFPAIDDLRENPSTYNLYFHSKGVTDPHHTQQTKLNSEKWHWYMLNFNVYKWRKCIKQLDDGYDAVGVEYRDWYYPPPNVSHYSGNFWWTTSEHLKKLVDYKFNYNYRMDAERFICSCPGRYMSNYTTNNKDLYYNVVEESEYNRWNPEENIVK